MRLIWAFMYTTENVSRAGLGKPNIQSFSKTAHRQQSAIWKAKALASECTTPDWPAHKHDVHTAFAPNAAVQFVFSIFGITNAGSKRNSKQRKVDGKVFDVRICILTWQ